MTSKTPGRWKPTMIFSNGLMTSMSQRGKHEIAKSACSTSIKASISNKEKEVVLKVNREKLNYAKAFKGQEVSSLKY